MSEEIGIKINLKTATILNYFKEAHTVFLKKIIDNEVYYKVEYKKVLEQNPLLDIEVKQLSRHFDKLVEMGILKKEIVKNSGTETYFATGKNYIKCFFETQDKNVLSRGQKCPVAEDKNVLSIYKHKNNKHKEINIKSQPKNLKFDLQKISKSLKIDITLLQPQFKIIEKILKKVENEKDLFYKFLKEVREPKTIDINESVRSFKWWEDTFIHFTNWKAKKTIKTSEKEKEYIASDGTIKYSQEALKTYENILKDRKSRWGLELKSI